MSYSKDPARRRAQRVLSMVSELHKRGYQRLRFSPMPLDGAGWRCALTSASNVLRSDGLKVAYFDMSNTLVCGGSASDYVFGSAARGASARELADMFEARFGGLPEACQGRDWAYAGWFVELLGAAEKGHLLVADENAPLNGSQSVRTMRFPDAVGDPPELLPPPPGEAEDLRYK